MLRLHNACVIFRKFSWLYYLYLQFENRWMLFIHETFLVYKLETFENCKEVKHIMFLIIAIIYIFFILLWYLINSWKLLSENPQPPPPPEKINSPLKIQEVQVPPFCLHWKFLSPPLPPAERGWGGHYEEV